MPCKKQVRGFTLVELLTVVAVIALLGAITLAALSSVRVRANQAVCSSNMRQLGTAILLYANEHAGAFPGSNHGTTEGGMDGTDNEVSWTGTLRPYVGEDWRIAISPADPLADERLEADASSYAMSDVMTTVQRDRRGNVIQTPPKLQNLVRPSDTAVLFPIAEEKGISASNDHIHSAEWTTWGAVISDIQPNLHRGSSSNANKTNGTANYLFADGHVESIPAADLKAMIEAGENFSMPQRY
ncbi:MAG: prepilin-type N-terminal cleavage/methylation domain-containing protein [Puniceicoccales bacterium]